MKTVPLADEDDPKQPQVVSLQSQEHRDLLDIIDKLRSQGINRYINLPQIVVCGDQSSGKSSVLEAISGMSFPTKDGLCTRFPTELILRRSSSSSVNVTIIPAANRSDSEKEALLAFSASISVDNPDIANVVAKAKEAMGLCAPGADRGFSRDILRVEFSAPQQPHLTLVDLPGLFEAGNSQQSEEDASMVESMVRGYMENPRSIILAVVSAKSEFAVQKVTKFTRQVDPTACAPWV
jgi:GTPase SAR1 family protein